MKSIFEHTDYRLYLREHLAEKKAQDPSWTHRYICHVLGLRTSNFILLVTQGKRNLTPDLSSKISVLLKHSEIETAYFSCLVQFGQARNALEKDFYWKSLLALRTRSSSRTLDTNQYEYYSHWYNPVLRELVSLPGIEWTTRSLSKALKPRVPAVQVRHSLELLATLGLVRKNGDFWEKTDTSVATPPEVRSVAVFNYQRELMDLARHSLENDSHTIRNFTTLTLEMNAQEYAMVVDMLTQFRREVLGVCASTGPADRVYQLNLQLFPLTHTVDSVKTLPDNDDEE